MGKIYENIKYFIYVRRYSAESAGYALAVSIDVAQKTAPAIATTAMAVTAVTANVLAYRQRSREIKEDSLQETKKKDSLLAPTATGSAVFSGYLAERAAEQFSQGNIFSGCLFASTSLMCAGVSGALLWKASKSPQAESETSPLLGPSAA